MKNQEIKIIEEDNVLYFLSIGEHEGKEASAGLSADHFKNIFEVIECFCKSTIRFHRKLEDSTQFITDKELEVAIREYFEEKMRKRFGESR